MLSSIKKLATILTKQNKIISNDTIKCIVHTVLIKIPTQYITTIKPYLPSTILHNTNHAVLLKKHRSREYQVYTQLI